MLSLAGTAACGRTLDGANHRIVGDTVQDCASGGDCGDAAPDDATSGDDASADDADAAPLPVPGVDGALDASAFGTLCPQAGSAGALDVWRDQLGSYTLADRGRILDCVHLATYSQSQVAAGPYFSAQAKPTNGYELYVVQYVSESPPGTAKSVTGLVYAPNGGGTSIPIAAVDHEATGMGPSCGPSHDPALIDGLAVPLVGRGYAVVATDYAGMGVDNGMTSMLVGTSEAASTLDGVRALLRFHERRFDASQLSTELFAVGYSQGGHAALFTHQLFDPSIGVRLLGSVAFAPGLGNAQDWSASFNAPSQPLPALGPYVAMSLYSHMLSADKPDLGTWLTPAAVNSLPAMFHDHCTDTIPATLATLFPTQGDLYTSSFTSAAAACSFGSGSLNDVQGTNCPAFEPWASWFTAEQPGNFASSAPVLLLQGASDPLVLPADTRCILDRLQSNGTAAQACAYAGLDHLSIVSGALPDAIRWMAARRTGETPSVCSATITDTCTLP
ncbi:MAG TPA: lipase family protein [Polyangiaceae bacterium]|nr:lipase family protein [Polyangiaceae bacterium]